ncbi:MAG: hypothetical protein JWM56_1354 [Candidatus Peribacteria bacterium]|nr:hypothetical protein [Candidatus Peribacteria bacterium]
MSGTPLLSSPLFVCSTAFVCSFALHGLALVLFPKIGLVDYPERYGHKRAPIPYPVGIVSVGLFLAFFSIIEPFSIQKAGVVGAIVLLAVFCFTDDRRPLPALLRTGVQLATALIVFISGTRIYSLTNPLADTVIFGNTILSTILKLDIFTITVPHMGSLPVLSGIFTIVWLGMTINAVNWFDGIPGQVPLLSTLAFLTIGFLSLSSRVHQPQLALIAFVLAGIAGGCLVFNIPPPRMLIGDTGSMFFGLMIGILTIYSGGKVATAFLVLGVPLFDSIFVVIRRLRKRSSIFRGNTVDEHLHHRLLQKGWSPRQILCLTAMLGTGFGVTALFMDTFGKFIAMLVLGFLLMAISRYSAPTKQKM